MNEKVSIKQFPGDQNMESKEQEKKFEIEKLWNVKAVGSCKWLDL